MERGMFRIMFPKMIGIIIYLLIVGVMNYLTKYITFNFFISFVEFFNSNTLIIILIIVLFAFAEIASQMNFPSNLFSPLLNFAGIWLTLNVFFSVLESIQKKFTLETIELILNFKIHIYIAILSAIVIFGLLPIIYRSIKNRKEKTKEEINILPEKIEKVIVKEEIKKIPKKRGKNVKRNKNKRN
jgi:hypothetical protein